MESAFDKPNSFYTRDLNILEHYTEDAARYLAIITRKPFELAYQWVKAKLKDPRLGFKDPRVLYLGRDPGKDRELKKGTFLRYLFEVESNRFVMSPTMTAYTNPEVEESVLAQYIKHGLAQRSQNKKMMLDFKNKGDSLNEGIYNNRQQRNKIKNNSMSGAHGTTSSVLFNKSSHSSLTTTCRSATSNTNANVERLLGGNRHYWSADIAINNIVSVINCSDPILVQRAIDHYGLAIPTAAQVIKAIKRSTDIYWTNEVMFQKIIRLVDGMSNLERATWLYTGDFYHINQYNDAVMRDFMGYLAEPSEDMKCDDAVAAVDELGEDELALLGVTCDHILKGGKLWDKEIIATEEYGIIGNTAKKIKAGIQKYDLLIDAFLMNKSMCPSMAMFPSSVRSIVVASDTDSCIFTNQQWVEWYNGTMDMSKRSFDVAASTTYICSKYVTHILKLMSGNMGVADRHLDLLQMKNEYAFKFFALTSMAKHYYASMDAQEGNVYSKSKWERKGVTLKNSVAPKEVVQASDDLIEYIGNSINENKPMQFMDILQEVANIEHAIIHCIKKGDSKFFRRIKIYEQKTYKVREGNKSPVWGNYVHYDFWSTTFGKRYDVKPEIPYTGISVKSTIETKTQWNHFLDTMVDRKMAETIRDRVNWYNKKEMKTFILPQDIVSSKGIPDEILDIMNVRDMVKNLMKAFYLVLESLGYYKLNKKVTKLVSDSLPFDKNHTSILYNTSAQAVVQDLMNMDEQEVNEMVSNLDKLNNLNTEVALAA